MANNSDSVCALPHQALMFGLPDKIKAGTHHDLHYDGDWIARWVDREKVALLPNIWEMCS